VPVLCTGYVVREFRRARQDFGKDSAMTDEPERLSGSRLPADLVHLRGTDGYHQRLKRGADWELLNRAGIRFCRRAPMDGVPRQRFVGEEVSAHWDFARSSRIRDASDAVGLRLTCG
jgi:hypothetical protein